MVLLAGRSDCRRGRTPGLERIAHIAGLVISGDHESPVPYAHIVTTTTHKTLRGPRGGIIMVTRKGLEKDVDLEAKINSSVFPGLQGGPHENNIAAKAVALLEAQQPEFVEYGHQIVRNSRALASSLMRHGIKLVTGGTDNHMALLDLTPYGIGTGIFAQEALESAGITVNRNTIPSELSTSYYPSGIRLGTPALTTRGMAENEMENIGEWIASVINSVSEFKLPQDREDKIKILSQFRQSLGQNQVILEVKQRVLDLCAEFPLYPDFYVLN